MNLWQSYFWKSILSSPIQIHSTYVYFYLSIGKPEYIFMESIIMLGDIPGQPTQPAHMTLLQDQLCSMAIAGKASFPCLRGSEQKLLSGLPWWWGYGLESFHCRVTESKEGSQSYDSWGHINLLTFFIVCDKKTFCVYFPRGSNVEMGWGVVTGQLCEWAFQNLGMTLSFENQSNICLPARRVRIMVWKLEGLINTSPSFAIMLVSCFSALVYPEENDSILHLNKFPVQLHE